MVVTDMDLNVPPNSDIKIKSKGAGAIEVTVEDRKPGQQQQQQQQQEYPPDWNIDVDVVNRDRIDWGSIRRDRKVLAIVFLNTEYDDIETLLDHLSKLHKEYATTNDLCLLGVTDQIDDADEVREFAQRNADLIQFPLCIDRKKPSLTGRVRDSINDHKTVPLSVVYDQTGNVIWKGEPRKLGLETTIRELLSTERGSRLTGQEQIAGIGWQGAEQRGAESAGIAGSRTSWADEESRLAGQERPTTTTTTTTSQDRRGESSATGPDWTEEDSRRAGQSSDVLTGEGPIGTGTTTTPSSSWSSSSRLCDQPSSGQEPMEESNLGEKPLSSTGTGGMQQQPQQQQQPKSLYDIKPGMSTTPGAAPLQSPSLSLGEVQELQSQSAGQGDRCNIAAEQLGGAHRTSPGA